MRREQVWISSYSYGGKHYNLEVLDWIYPKQSIWKANLINERPDTIIVTLKKKEIHMSNQLGILLFKIMESSIVMPNTRSKLTGWTRRAQREFYVIVTIC